VPAEEALEVIAPMLGEAKPSKPQGVDWAVRGVSSVHLRQLRANAALRLFVAAFLGDGQLVADPLK
jgi:hypothetical protein